MTCALSVSENGRLEALYKNVLSNVDLEKISELQRQPNGIDLVVHYVSKFTPRQGAADAIKDLVAENVQGCTKDNILANELREAGNKLFSSKQYYQAARVYSDALRHLCLEKTIENADASKILCNRALALYRLEEYSKAEEDCSVALEYQSSNVKALYWRALARFSIGNEPGFKADAQRCIAMLGQQHLDSLKLKDLLLTKSSHTDQRKEKEKSLQNFQPSNETLRKLETKGDCPNLLLHVQAALEANTISSALQVQDSKGFGRHISSSEPIASGSDLFQDFPFVHAMQKGHRLKHCATCLRALNQGDLLIYWPCVRCASVVFCSLDCRDEKEKFHKPGNEECGFAWPSVLPVEAVLALRFASQMLRKGGPNLRQDQTIMGSLLHHFQNLSPEASVFESVFALVLHALWSEAVAKSSCGLGISLSPATILWALCVIRINAVSITTISAGITSHDGAVGLGLYPVTSFLAHSCTPNVSLRFDGIRLTVRSIENLPAFSPLLHSYGPQSGEMTTKQRQLMLSHQYAFYCRCLTCSNPPESEKEMVGLACTTAGCPGVFSAPGSLKSGLVSAYNLVINDQSASCSICGAILDLMEWESKFRPQLERAKEAFISSSTCIDDVEECIYQLKQSLEIRGSLLHKHNQLLGETHSRLAELYKISGQPDLAILHQSFALKTAERLYPHTSTNVAFEMLALSVLLQIKNHPEWKLLYQQAYSYLQLHYGSSAAAAVVNST